MTSEVFRLRRSERLDGSLARPLPPGLADSGFVWVAILGLLSRLKLRMAASASVKSLSRGG